jgi:hypothetical protein
VCRTTSYDSAVVNDDCWMMTKRRDDRFVVAIIHPAHISLIGSNPPGPSPTATKDGFFIFPTWIELRKYLAGLPSRSSGLYWDSPARLLFVAPGSRGSGGCRCYQQVIVALFQSTTTTSSQRRQGASEHNESQKRCPPRI